MKAVDDAYLSLFLKEPLYNAPNRATGVAEMPATEEVATPDTTAAAPTPGVAEPIAPPLDFMGENKRGVVIMVHYPDHPYLPEDHRALLGKILQAVKLDWPDVALFNLQHSPIDHPGWNTLAANQVLAFGVQHPWIGDTPLYKNTPHGNRVILAADTLAQIAADRNRKAQLWGALQQLFT